jgi:hypothetical protein
MEEYFSPASVAYFEQGDAKAMAHQVDRLLRHPEEARHRATRAKEVLRTLSRERCAPSYLAMIGLPK